MLSWMKYLAILLFFGAIIAVSNHFFTLQKINVTTIQEVDGLLRSVNIGELRSTDHATLQRETMLQELLLSIASSQKNHQSDIRVSYVFLNKDGQVTESEEEIAGVQVKVDTLNKDGEVESSSERRLILKEG